MGWASSSQITHSDTAFLYSLKMERRKKSLDGLFWWACWDQVGMLGLGGHAGVRQQS